MPLDNKVFRRPPEQPVYQLTINSEGLERSGKTDFALKAPDPIGVIALDKNTINIAIKKQRDAGKTILLADFCDPNPKTNPGLAQFVLPERSKPGIMIKTEQKATKPFYERRWEAICTAYFDLVNDPSIRTIVIDTGTQLWEDIRLARFGALSKIAPREYGAVNGEMREMIMAAKCNLIVTHKLGKLYEGNDWKGKYEGKGWGDVAFACNTTIRHSCQMITDPDTKEKKPHFVTSVSDCSYDSSLKGLELTDEDCDFKVLASLIYPDAPDECWA